MDFLIYALKNKAQQTRKDVIKMAISFSSLPWNASLDSIYDQAGRIFEEQVRNDPETDYTDPQAFNTAIWFIAKKAHDWGFSALQSMSPRDVASGIGNHLSAYLNAQGPGSFAPHVLAVLAMKAAALAHAYPQLTAQVFITAAQAVFGGKTPVDVAKAVATNAVIGNFAEKQLEGWLAGLKIHLCWLLRISVPKQSRKQQSQQQYRSLLEVAFDGCPRDLEAFDNLNSGCPFVNGVKRLVS